MKIRTYVNLYFFCLSPVFLYFFTYVLVSVLARPRSPLELEATSKVFMVCRVPTHHPEPYPFPLARIFNSKKSVLPLLLLKLR